MRIAKCATIGFRVLAGIVYVTATSDTRVFSEGDALEQGATQQAPSSETTPLMQSAGKDSEAQDVCIDCMVQQIVPLNELGLDDDQQAALARQLGTELSRLVDETADKLHSSRKEVFDGVDAVIRAREGTRLRSRPRFNPSEIFSSIYNEQSKRLVGRMFELLRRFIAAYAKAAAADDAPSNSGSSPAATGITPNASVSLESSSNESTQTSTTHPTPTSSATAKNHTSSKSHSTARKNKTATDRDGSHNSSDGGEADDDGEDNTDENEDGNDREDKKDTIESKSKNNKNNGKPKTNNSTPG
ncbi:hypothetical protein GGI25_000395 [Coemansia spiralis]|uniref:Uncharacterized protein n=1 Tax=Coemansia spiralis TaxID=417178 RepID=A0A9W8GEX4_9FUNG|nr:hypothetical protein GGI25_000395 [Coemansia spiralis]